MYKCIFNVKTAVTQLFMKSLYIFFKEKCFFFLENKVDKHLKPVLLKQIDFQNTTHHFYSATCFL